MTNRSSSGFSVLADPLFTIGSAGARLSLTALLARLLAADGEEIIGFSRVAAEQQGHWWRFLARCAARALHNAGMAAEDAAAATADSLESTLHDALDGLADSAGWMLYQPDLRRPGFLQVPIPDGDLQSEGYKANTLALLTGLLGEKDHERKYDVDRVLDAERTAYALVEYQTAAIYGGRGNYASQLTGSASGAGSGTPFVGAWVADSYRATFRHDVGVMLDRHESIRRDLGLAGEVWALWTLPWNGESSLEVKQLDPAFIPLARRVRLGAPDERGRFDEVWFAASNKSRVSDASAGNLGDPFIPIVPNPQASKKNQPAEKARGTLSGNIWTGGYDYREAARLLFGENSRPSPSVAALAARVGEDVEIGVRFWGIAYAQGKTEGISRRVLPLPAFGDMHSARLVSDDDRTRAEARRVHAWMLIQIRDFKNAVNTALRVYLHGLDEQGRIPKKKSGDDEVLSESGAHFEYRVDGGGAPPEESYFNHLFPLVLAGDGTADGSVADIAPAKIYCGRWLEGIARDTFDASLAALRVPEARRIRREVEARDILDALLARCRAETDAASNPAPKDDDDEEL